jgi:hypothetical protein
VRGGDERKERGGNTEMSVMELTCQNCREKTFFGYELPANLACQKCDCSTFVFGNSAKLRKFFENMLLEEKMVEKGSIFDARYRTPTNSFSSVWTALEIAPIVKDEPKQEPIPKPVFVPITEDKVPDKPAEPVKPIEKPKQGIKLRLKR